MRPFLLPCSASPASGVLRGVRAGVLAVLCVLLPLVGHVLSQGHTPRWAVVAAMALVAVPGAAVLTRWRLTDTQLLGVLAAAQLAYHVAYSLPGACAAVAGQGGFGSGPWLVEHDAISGPPRGVLLAGHLITLLLAARLLGVTERLLWQSRPLSAAVRSLLAFVWPLLGRVQGAGPQVTFVESAAPLKSAVLMRLREGRAPPRAHRPDVLPDVLPHVLPRPMPIGGPCLP
ncbi:hypothetical protein ACFV2X_07225 [Streptomyces sp. NPDC059679]|uniref:hypothetical protein n=1 Tax=Streptomyces sp. NPDC059679 TaxID=3346903 RepID=UPI00368A59D8